MHAVDVHNHTAQEGKDETAISTSVLHHTRRPETSLQLGHVVGSQLGQTES